MSPVSAVNSSGAAAVSGKNQQALQMEDFMKIMLTELTNQDPLEPMTNKELLDQMSSIQQLQSSQNMTESFEKMIDRLDGLMLREQVGSAGSLLGQFVTGASESGMDVYGKVIGVTIDQNEVLLELNTGFQVNLTDVHTLGDRNSQDVVGDVVMARSGADDGSYAVGRVAAVEVGPAGTVFELENGTRVAADTAVRLNADNASLLIGEYVQAVLAGAGEDGGDLTLRNYVEAVQLDESGDVWVRLDDAASTAVRLDQVRMVIPRNENS